MRSSIGRGLTLKRSAHIGGRVAMIGTGMISLLLRVWYVYRTSFSYHAVCSEVESLKMLLSMQVGWVVIVLVGLLV